MHEEDLNKLEKMSKSTVNDGDQLKTKYNTQEKKLQDERLKTIRLKDELNKATRIIKRECGEYSNLDELLENESWKGRAQQIEILKSKVKDLQVMSQSQIDLQKMGKSGGGYYTKSKEPLGESAASRRREIDSARNENAQLKRELENIQGRIRGQNSRNKILEDEIRTIKTDYEMNKQLLMEKSDNDTKYIQALKSEMAKAKREIERLRSKPSETLTRVVYKAKEEIEPSS